MATEKIKIRNSLALLSVLLLVSSLVVPVMNASALLSNTGGTVDTTINTITDPIPSVPDTQTITNTINQTISTVPDPVTTINQTINTIPNPTSSVNQTASTILTPITDTTQTIDNLLKPVGIKLNNVQSTSGAASNEIILPAFDASAGKNRTLVVGISANNNDVASVSFGGIQLVRAVSSFVNNNAEIWYLTNPQGSADIIVTMSGPTDAVVGAYALSGVDQANPIQTTATNSAVVGGSPSITVITKYPNDLVLDVPSIYGGSTLDSSTCTQQWNVNVPNAITGASSSKASSLPGMVTCSWKASSDELWDDVVVELKAAGTTIFLPGSPASPTNLVANTVSDSQIDLNWNAPSTSLGGLPVIGYKIERSTDNGNTWSTLVSNTLSTATDYSDTGLGASTTYTYRVSAINLVGTSSPSNTASATTASPPSPTVPQPPTGLTATSTSSSQINLSWNAPNNNGGSAITGYKIERSTDGTTWSAIASNTGSTSTAYSDSGLNTNTTYTYRVSAINAVGTSSPSNTASATTSSSSSGGITVFAHRIPADYWDPCFATKCDQGTGPGVTMWIALYDFNGNYLTGGFADENGFTFTNLSSLTTYYVYPTDCENCHGDPHDVVFQYWGDDQTNVRPRAATVGDSLDAWYSCTNNCAGVP